MRQLTEHQINECNQAIEITADEPDPNNGNASHEYRLTIKSPCGGPFRETILSFQHGPIKEVGTNGITHEALLAVLLDRLRGFQAGPYACRENALALTKLEEATMWLHARTKKRVERGVEGTHKV
jgi:hypothetical protein